MARTFPETRIPGGMEPGGKSDNPTPKKPQSQPTGPMK